MKICFIGGGNMAGAMIGGLLMNGSCKPGDVHVVEISDAARARLADSGVNVHASADAQVIASCAMLVLAVKPQQMRELATGLGTMLVRGQIVLSIAAGIRLVDLARWLGAGAKTCALVRAMPNTPALVNAGMTGLYAPHLDAGQRTLIEELIHATGKHVWVESESDLDAVTAISGSGPAYFFYFIEALTEAGKGLGLPADVARQLAVETALGAAKLAHESPEDPATLRARVTSKNGTTERALLSMESNHVKQHIMDAAHAAALRAREMGDELGSA